MLKGKMLQLYLDQLRAIVFVYTMTNAVSSLMLNFINELIYVCFLSQNEAEGIWPMHFPSYPLLLIILF